MPLFIALGGKTRLSVIEVLTKETLNRKQIPGPVHFEQYGLNVSEITRRISLSHPAVSHHLKTLRDTDIVGVRQEGAASYCYLTLRESDYRLMELGYRLEEFLY